MTILTKNMVGKELSINSKLKEIDKIGRRTEIRTNPWLMLTKIELRT